MDGNQRLFLSYLDEMNMITILLPMTYHNGLSSSFTLSAGLQVIQLSIAETKWIERYGKYICYFSGEISFDKTYWITDEHGGKTDLQIGSVIRTSQFDKKFHYTGNDLGITWCEGKIIFKLWAPTAINVKIKLRPPDGSFNKFIKMKRGEKGVWAGVIKDDLENYRYSYLVCVNLVWREAVDPYVNAVTVNGEQGVIMNLEKTRRHKPKLPPFEHPVDAIIYETHIRDFTIHPNSGAKHKGLYLGAGETNLIGNDGNLTGLSYVKSLGVTHIEFLPVNDFAGIDEAAAADEYNWGYNPLHYNVPEGSYATDPSEPSSRIIELKHLIEQIHLEGLRVVIDVVYNHVYIREHSSFEKIVPGYYFRHDKFGMPSNGTGVGNDLASERLMVRKFIIDSIRFWIMEYDVDGFRFDLMGILDVTTMNEIRTVCDSLKTGILLLGEGWNLPTPLPLEEKAAIINEAKLPGISHFNDWFRDSIKGSTFNLFDKGYAFGNESYYEAAKEVIAGSIGFLHKESKLFNEPSQSVNYVENHDNHTMWDKLINCSPVMDESLLIRHHRLATCIVLLSQGIPFLHGGQEFLRTKNGIGNSYRSPDAINQMDWVRKSNYLENTEYVKGFIMIRRKFPCFRLKSAEEIRRCLKIMPMQKPLIGCMYQNPDEKFHEVILIINPGCSKVNVRLPDGEWFVIANEKRIELEPSRKITQSDIIIEPVSLNIYASE